MIFQRFDGLKTYRFIAIAEAGRVILENEYSCRFSADMRVLLAGYEPVLEDGDFWPEGMPHQDHHPSKGTNYGQ